MAYYSKIAQDAPVYPSVTTVTAGNMRFFTVMSDDGAYVLDGIVESHTTAATAGTLQVRKVTSGQAISAGASVLVAAIDLLGAADTPVEPALTSTAASLQLNPGDGLAVQFIGVTGGAGWNVTARLKRVRSIE